MSTPLPQSLFWASFGLVDLGDFDLKGIGSFTRLVLSANCLMLPNIPRFAGLLMFGSYSVCNIIVLLNMLIAMMSNSYQVGPSFTAFLICSVLAQ